MTDTPRARVDPGFARAALRVVSAVGIGYIMGSSFGALVAFVGFVAVRRISASHVALVSCALLCVVAVLSVARASEVVSYATAVGKGGWADIVALAAAVLLGVAWVEAMFDVALKGSRRNDTPTPG